MQIKLFTIPVLNIEEHNEELNKFLRMQNIIEIEKELIQINNSAYWCFYIHYINSSNKIKPTKEKVDYKKVLKEEEFKKFSKLRELRKVISIEEAISAYIIFTDAELAEIAKMKEPTINNIRKIKGIGDKKAEKYGKRFLSELNKNEKTS